MSDPSSSPGDVPARPPARKRTNPLLLFLLALVPVAVVGYVMYEAQVRKPLEENREFNSKLVYKTVGLLDAAPLKLADRFADTDGDLVAEGPTDPKQVVNPPTLMFSYVGTSKADSERLRDRFKEFTAFLSQKIGKPVEYAAYANPEDELRALCDGKLHVAGVNTGNVALAVNQCGFVPFAMLASEQGTNTYRMQIIVPADSSMQKLADLRGHELTLTEPGSNSGFKAPLVLLSRDNGLQPAKDFTIRYSGGHNESIVGIANHTYQAAAVASDLLQRAMAEDPPLIKKDQYRVIYESEDFPTAGFGYVCTLKPELAAKVKEAFFSFQWKGTGVEREFAASAQSKFVPCAFKKDFALIRRIDDAIRSVPASSVEEEPATTQSTTMTTSAPATTQK